LSEAILENHTGFITIIPPAYDYWIDRKKRIGEGGGGRVFEAAGKGIAMSPHIHLDKEKIASFCRKNQIRRLALFGSVLRDDFKSGSDVDVLVEFEPGHTPGLAFFRMEEELSVLLGRTVDLNTPGFLSHWIRDKVIAESSIQYDAAA